MSGLFTPGEYASAPKALLAEPSNAVSAAAKLVYLGLSSYLSGDKRQAWPGPEALRKRTGLSRRAIQKGIDKLVAVGWIDKVSKGGPDGTNLYTLHDRRKKCASAQNAPPLAQKVRKASAKNAPKVPKGSTPAKNSNKGRRKATPNPDVTTFLDFFCKTYAEKLDRPYIVTGGKDGTIIKRLLQSVPLEELQQAARNMLADAWGKDRASIGLLSSQINTWRGKSSAGKGQSNDYSNGF